MGSKYASVLPEPVGAFTNTSRPCTHQQEKQKHASGCAVYCGWDRELHTPRRNLWGLLLYMTGSSTRRYQMCLLGQAYGPLCSLQSHDSTVCYSMRVLTMHKTHRMHARHRCSTRPAGAPDGYQVSAEA